MDRTLRDFLDLALVALWTGVVVSLAARDVTGLVRAAAVVPFVTLLPGYALLAAAFPTVGTHATDAFDRTGSGLQNRKPTKSGVDGTERFAFAVVLSVVVVAAVALVANFTPRGVTVGPILIGVAGWTLLSTLVAFVRRWRLDPDERYVPRPLAFAAALGYDGGSDAFLGRDSRVGLADVALCTSMLLFATSVGYAAVNPPQETASSGFTELYVDSGNVTGDVQSRYPSQFAPGENRTLHVGVANREHESVDYRLLVFEQRTDGAGANATVLSERRVDRRTVSLDHGETTTAQVSASPTTTGTDLRFVVLLYEGRPPTDPGVDSAYRALRLPITVTEDGDATGA